MSRDTPLDKTRRAELLFAVFGVLQDHPDGVAARVALAEVEDRIVLTAYEQENYPGTDIRRFEKTVRFQTIPAVKAGWMIKEKGLWSITEDGDTAYKLHPGPEPFYDEAVALYRAWDKEHKASRDTASATQDEDGPVAHGPSITLETAEETAFQEIWSYLGAMNPYDFQELVAGLLQGMGYHIDWVAPPGKDRGVDVIALQDPLGVDGPRIKVQVKREQSKTDVKGLRAFMSVLSAADTGVFVTLGGFTIDAEIEARTSESRRVTLIDRNRLLDLWIEYRQHIPDARRALLPLRPVHYLAREDEGGS
ncbi:MAG TPA: restriction endonuclease [Solirubrobacteraceae bacterium]|jgi:restriction system protein|nr:restriction endonuclease [Solirubrobacteraceae bacterium]